MKFYASVVKGLKLKLRKVLALIPTFEEVTEEKLVAGGPFAPSILNRVKRWSRQSLIRNAQKSYIGNNIPKSIIFEKESFINAKKVLNFVQSLINEMKVIKPASKRRSIILRHTIKPGTPEHGTTEHGTPAEHWNTGGTTKYWKNNRNTT